MPRPKDNRERRKFLVNLRLVVGVDDDLIQLLSISHNRAALVKSALRGAYVGVLSLTHDDDAPTDADLNALDTLMF